MNHFRNLTMMLWTITSIVILNSCLELLTEADTASNWFGIVLAILVVYLSYYTKLGTKILLITNYFKRNKNV